MMTRQERIAIIWGMNGFYYDAIMNRCPVWVDEDNFDDWFFSEIGL